MKISLIYVVLAALCFLYYSEASAQGLDTRITQITIDGKATQKNYRVFFELQHTWIEATRTSKGFIVPDALSGDQNLTVLIKIGKYQLEFPDVDISKFRTSWVVGIDTPPFSDEVVEAGECDSLEMIYWIKFFGSSATNMMVKVKKE